MKLFLLVGFLLADWFGISSAATTHDPPVVTNILSFHLVAGRVSEAALRDGTAEPYGLELIRTPILSDPDFVSWNARDHSFVITPIAAIRIAASCSNHNAPFVLMSRGEPLYVGVFSTGYSSAWIGVPEINTMLVLSECFGSLSNVPLHVLRLLDQGDPGAMSRLLALTNSATNVTLRIERGLPSPDRSVRAVDKRNDPRIALAVEKLFGNRKH